MEKRYALVQDETSDWYVIEADQRDAWFEGAESQAARGLLSWAHPVGGAESQVTFASPEIFGDPVEEAV